MPGNFTPLMNSTNLVTLTQTMNTASGYLLGNLMVLVAFVVTFVVVSKAGTERALTVTSFITCIMTILLRLLNMCSDWVLTITIVIAALMATITIIQNIE